MNHTLRRLPSPYRLTDERGQSQLVDRIGKGRFTTAYRSQAHPETVYLVVPDDCGDYSKEILEDCDKNPHLPELEKLGTVGDSYLYRTRYYRRLRASDKVAWVQYRKLQAANESARHVCAPRMTCATWGYDAMQQTITYLENELSVPQLLIDALDAIADSATNYGSEYTFEFCPRNLAVDETGTLILLDPVFSLETVQRQGEIAAQRRQFASRY